MLMYITLKNVKDRSFHFKYMFSLLDWVIRTMGLGLEQTGTVPEQMAMNFLYSNIADIHNCNFFRKPYMNLFGVQPYLLQRFQECTFLMFHI